MKTIILSCILFLIACNPYRRISGDQNRKPFEKQILLQEAAREASAQPDIPAPSFDSTELKNYINSLSESLKITKEEYDNIAKLTDSLYYKNISLDSLKTILKNKISQQNTAISILKNAPAVIQKITYLDTSCLIAKRLSDQRVNTLPLS